MRTIVANIGFEMWKEREAQTLRYYLFRYSHNEKIEISSEKNYLTIFVNK